MEKFNNLGNVQNRTGWGRSPVFKQAYTARSYSPTSTQEHLWGENYRCTDSMPQHTEHAKQAGPHVSIQDNKSTLVTSARLCSMGWPLSIVYGQHVVQFRFLMSARFSNECIFHVTRVENTQNMRTCGTKSQGRFNNMNSIERKKQFDVQCNPIVR